MGTLFISHSSLNNSEAIELRDWLQGEGYAQTFLDLDPEHGLAPGHRWEEELKKAGERCSGIVVLLSPEWAASKWCFHEFKFAKALGKKIFPVLVHPTSFEELPRELHAHYQIADISDASQKADGLNRLRIGLQRAGLHPNHFNWPPENEPNRKPYRGLQSFSEPDAAVFFGRDAHITAGLDKLRQIRDGSPKNILVVAAASGAGKSSYLKAGLLARLERDIENFVVLPTVRPGLDALNGEEGLCAAIGIKSEKIEDGSLVERMRALQAPALQRLRDPAFSPERGFEPIAPTLVLPIDQAEELFSPDNLTGMEAAELLARCLAQMPDLVPVLTIRSDSLDRLQQLPKLADHLEVFSLPPLPPAAFKEVIEGPASLAVPPIKIEPSLTERLIHDLDRSDALPMLAFTLERLVDKFGDDNLLEFVEYTDHLGGISGAINAAVENAMENAESNPRLPSNRIELDALAKRTFIPMLVQLDNIDASPRRRVARMNDLPKEAFPLVEHFVDERLLVMKFQRGERVVEVSHEAVLRHWRGLAAWIGEERASLSRLQEVVHAANQLVNAEEQVSELQPLDSIDNDADEWRVHRGERLALAEQLLERSDYAKALEGAPENYLAQCRRAETERVQLEQHREKRQRFWRRVSYSAGAVSIALFVSLITLYLFAEKSVESLNAEIQINQDAIAETEELIRLQLEEIEALDGFRPIAEMGYNLQYYRDLLSEYHAEYSTRPTPGLNRTDLESSLALRSWDTPSFEIDASNWQGYVDLELRKDVDFYRGIVNRIDDWTRLRSVAPPTSECLPSNPFRPNRDSAGVGEDC